MDASNPVTQPKPLKMGDLRNKKPERKPVTLAQLIIEPETLDTVRDDEVVEIAPANMWAVMQFEKHYGSLDQMPANPDTMRAEDIVYITTVLVNQDLSPSNRKSEEYIAQCLKGDFLRQAAEVVWRMIVPLFAASQAQTIAANAGRAGLGSLTSLTNISESALPMTSPDSVTTG